MKNWLSSLLGPREPKDRGGDKLPWLDSRSIYDHIAQNIDPQTGKLTLKGKTLPDEERLYSSTQIRFAPGAMDGIFSHHAAPAEADAAVQQASSYVLEIATRNSNPAKIELYKILLQDETLSFIDDALNDILSKVQRPAPGLHSFAEFLARTAPDRGPVKFAIALLGILQDPRDVSIIMLLGLHEEFTLFAAVALSNMLADPESYLWSLAKKVDGWGKIHLVERLASTTSKEIKDWLLRDGYSNYVMNEYLAYTCAVGGGLRDALVAQGVDDDLLHGAGEIIDALLVGGPAQDIHDYTDAADVILRYVELVGQRVSEINQYLVLDSILGYLTDDWDMDASAANGWTADKRDRAIVLTNQTLQQPGWRGLAETGLQSSNEPEFYLAEKAAGLLGIDTWEVSWARLQEKPLDSGRWFAVMKNVDASHIDQVLGMAVSVLPLEIVARGPALELGLGLDYEVHFCLQFIVQDLKRFPGKGWSLIAAGLKSPIIPNRNQAVNALEAWGRDAWPGGAREALAEAAHIEPEEKLKVRLQNLIEPP